MPIRKSYFGIPQSARTNAPKSNSDRCIMLSPTAHTGRSANAGATHQVPSGGLVPRGELPLAPGGSSADDSEWNSLVPPRGQQSSASQGVAHSRIFEIANSQHISGAAQEAGDEKQTNNEPTKPTLSPDAQVKLKKARKVYVAGFSSQGGGHTERMLMPLLDSIKKDRAIDTAKDAVREWSFSINQDPKVEERDAVVLVLPPHWQSDNGNENKMLTQYKASYEKEGVDVITVQSDKAVLGYYLPEGASDNKKILEDFALKPFRDNSQTPQFGPQKGEPVQLVQGFTHKEIMSDIVVATGDARKITVLEDMDPYLAKGAVNAGVPKEQIVGLSNHITLLDADQVGRSDAFLVKADGNGYDGKVSTVALSKDINTTVKLGESLKLANVRENDRIVDVRQKMVDTFLTYGAIDKLDTAGAIKRPGGVMVAENATTADIDRGFAIYVNEYTAPVADFIRERLTGGGDDNTPELQAAYAKAMFVFCGPEALTDNSKGNALHMGKMANFDVISSAGFGITSEMLYLFLNNAFNGNLVLFPVENQHEQVANAQSLVPQAIEGTNLGTRISSAINIEDLKAHIDRLVTGDGTTNEKLGNATMAKLFKAATRTDLPKATDQTVNLLHGGPMTTDAARLLAENTRRASDPESKALRRLNKVMVPALNALANGEMRLTTKMTMMAEPQTLHVTDLIVTLRDPAAAGELMSADLSGQKAQAMSAVFADKLEELVFIDDENMRADAAREYLAGEYANNKYSVGY